MPIVGAWSATVEPGGVYRFATVVVLLLRGPRAGVVHSGGGWCCCA